MVEEVNPPYPYDPDRPFYGNSFWQKKAVEELNETPETYKTELAALTHMVENDHNLNVPEGDDKFLVRFLRARKYDSKKAFNMLQRYFLMKVKYRELFDCPLPQSCSDVFQLQAQLVLENRDPLGRDVYIIRIDYFEPTLVTINEIFRANVLALEYLSMFPETQISGVVVILDLAGVSLQHAKLFTPYYARRLVELVQETFPLRFKGFHIVNEPFYFDAIMAVFKPFLKEKFKKRIFLHGSNVDALHAYFPKNILPEVYGGTAGPFDNRKWFQQICGNADYFKELRKYGCKTEPILKTEDEEAT